MQAWKWNLQNENKVGRPVKAWGRLSEEEQKLAHIS